MNFIEDQDLDKDLDGRDDYEDNDDYPSTDAQIMSSLTELVHSGVEDKVDSEEDFIAYKMKMKALLEQLLLKLEEDVDYQKNLEGQVEDLEQELRGKNRDIERLSQKAAEAIEDTKQQAEEMAEKMLSKISAEVNQRLALEKVIHRLQAENSRLKSDLRIHRIVDVSSGNAGPGAHTTAAAYMTDLKAEVEDLKEQLSQSQREARDLRIQREAEMTAMMNVAKMFQLKLRELRRPAGQKESALDHIGV